MAKPALRTELFIKTGLVLSLGRKSSLTACGVGCEGLEWLGWALPSCHFHLLAGYQVMKIKQELVATVATATSVCGVSAAIATGAPCGRKRDQCVLSRGIHRDNDGRYAHTD